MSWVGEIGSGSNKGYVWVFDLWRFTKSWLFIILNARTFRFWSKDSQWDYYYGRYEWYRLLQGIYYDEPICLKRRIADKIMFGIVYLFNIIIKGILKTIIFIKTCFYSIVEVILWIIFWYKFLKLQWNDIMIKKNGKSNKIDSKYSKKLFINLWISFMQLFFTVTHILHTKTFWVKDEYLFSLKTQEESWYLLKHNYNRPLYWIELAGVYIWHAFWFFILREGNMKEWMFAHKGRNPFAKPDFTWVNNDLYKFVNHNYSFKVLGRLLVNNMLLNWSICIHIFLFYVFCLLIQPTSYYIFSFCLDNNIFIWFSKLIIVLLSLILLFILKYYYKVTFIKHWEFLIIYNFTIFTLLLLISAIDLVLLFFCIELYSLCLYILISFKQTSTYSTEAGLKYFIMSSVSAVLFLCGIWFIYLDTGLVNLLDLKLITFTSKYYYNLVEYEVLPDTSVLLRFFSDDIFIILGFILISISIFFKLTMAPFHLWALDVYEGTSTFVMIFLSIIPKIIFLIVFIKLYYFTFALFSHATSFFFLTISCVCFIVGSIGGVYQIKLKRLLVYSMIYNNGYFLLLLSIPSISNLAVLFYFLLIYLLNLLGLFICILSLRSSITAKQLTSIYSLLNIFRINPLLAFSFIFLLFSLSGIPPLIGFFGKFYLLFWSFNNHLFFILCLSLLTSIINVFYYMRLIKITTFIKAKNITFLEPLSPTLSIILFFILFLIICSLLIPSLFFNNFKIWLLYFL